MDKTEEQFLEISKSPLDTLSQHIAPHLVGQEWYWIRRGILMILATQNDTHTRNRLHMLLTGRPGTGKTELLLFLREQLHGVMINAELTSKVGLVGDARGNKITPGLLADYTNNVLLIDEIDKMSSKDANGLLQAMEEGTFCIIKGGHRQRFKSEIRAIATANTLEKIQKPLLDRFDFIFYAGTSTRPERADNVGKIVNSFTKGQKDEAGKIVTGYLEWIEGHDANMLPGDEETVKNMIGEYILTTRTNIDYVSYRSLELSMLRIAYAMAKLERTTMNNNHVKNAIWLKDQILRGIVGAQEQRRYY